MISECREQPSAEVEVSPAADLSADVVTVTIVDDEDRCTVQNGANASTKIMPRRNWFIDWLIGDEDAYVRRGIVCAKTLCTVATLAAMAGEACSSYI